MREKWAVVVPISKEMGDSFTDEELVTFGKVLAIYTLPEGDLISEPIAELVNDMFTDERIIRAYVRVNGVADTEATFRMSRLYEGASLTPDPPQEPEDPEGLPNGQAVGPETGVPEGAAPPE